MQGVDYNNLETQKVYPFMLNINIGPDMGLLNEPIFSTTLMIIVFQDHHSSNFIRHIVRYQLIAYLLPTVILREL